LILHVSYTLVGAREQRRFLDADFKSVIMLRGIVMVLDLSSYHLTFSDEFNSRIISQTGIGTTWADIRPQWRFDANSDIGFGRSSFVDPSSGYDPFNVHDGVLTITAVPDRTASGYPGSWESGLITTQGHFSQTYGYFEIRADFSNLPGAWGAFWLLPDHVIPDPNSAGHWQELDVVENYGSYEQGVYSGIHTTDAAPNVNWQRDLQVYTELSQPGGYHTYGLDWNENTISLYVDGQLIGTKTTPSDMHGPMYLLVNLATQNDPHNNADIAGVPISASIDYIRVYSPPSASTPTTTPPSPTTAADSHIGSGPDQIRLAISQDAYNGDAQYKVLVDGAQIGGIQTAHASHVAGQSDHLVVQGNWGSGTHDVAVVFMNDAWGGTPDTDRNLYLDGATYNGVNAHAQHALMGVGAFDFSIGASGNGSSAQVVIPQTTSPTPPPPTTAQDNGSIGSGPDRLVLSISEDAYNGDAQYKILVDGAQVGGLQTAHTSHVGGQSDQVVVQGNWGGGTHDVAVVFLNDAWGGTPDTDRNLYLDSGAYNGIDANAQHALMGVGAFNFSVGGSAVAGPSAPDILSPPVTSPTTTAPPVGAPPGGVVIGSGPDQFVFAISEDAYKGDAQYKILIDGALIGGIQTAHASHAASQSDHLVVRGNWGSGVHDIDVVFLNDAWDGTPDTDRNLYLDGATYNGVDAHAQHALMGVSDFHFLV
jgi:beta-glucanase (GH16 family)